MTEMSMENFIDTVCNDSRLRVEDDLGDGFVRLRSDEAERRQAAHDIRSSEDIVIELLRNSRDAHAKHIFLAVSKEGSSRSITVIDDGDGVPGNLHETIFEPRVTSKLDTIHMDKWGVHGRGMALFSVKTNSLSAQIASSASGQGCSLIVVTDVQKVSERVDQSSFPQLVMSDSGVLSFRGPRNIVRTACEFAFEHRESLSVYFGSPTEIAAALYSVGLFQTTPSQRAFDSKDSVRIPFRLCFAASDKDFQQIANEIGLPMSARTARRIMDGEIAPAQNLLHRIASESFPNKSKSHSKKNASSPSDEGSSSKLKLSSEDKEAFESAIRVSFEELAGKYYLEADVDTKVSIEKDVLRISIPLVPRQ